MPPESDDGQAEWERAVDPETGMEYEYNVVTNETRWVTEPEDDQQDALPPDEDDDAKEDGEMPPESDDGQAEWERAVDPETGMEYEYNVVTNETRWVTEPEDDQQDALPPDEDNESKDE